MEWRRIEGRWGAMRWVRGVERIDSGGWEDRVGVELDGLLPVLLGEGG